MDCAIRAGVGKLNRFRRREIVGAGGKPQPSARPFRRLYFQPSFILRQAQPRLPAPAASGAGSYPTTDGDLIADGDPTNGANPGGCGAGG